MTWNRFGRAGSGLALAVVVAGCGIAAPAAGLRSEAPKQGETAGGSAGAGTAQRSSAVAADKASAVAPAMGAASGPPAMGVPGAAAGNMPSSAQSAPQLPPLPSVDRMIVKTGTLTVQVSDLTEAMQRVGGVVAGIPGAYIAASTTSYRADAPAATGADAIKPMPPDAGVRPVPPPGGGQSASVTLKVPAGSFNEAMQRLRELGKPLTENISTQEVTEEFVDLEAQVRNLEATEQQYLRLMERAQKIEEILPLQQRLNDVRGQIERLRGRMNLLQRRSDVSTITVSLTLPARGGESASTLPRPIRTLQEAWSGMRGFLQGLLDVVIYLGVYVLPFVPIAGLVWWWRIRERRAATPTPGSI